MSDSPLHDGSYIILGKRWRLVFVRFPSLGRRRSKDGECDAPDSPNKKIRIGKHLHNRPRRLLEVIIHECLHAADWHKDDAWVETVSEDVAKILWAQGFRLGRTNPE